MTLEARDLDFAYLAARPVLCGVTCSFAPGRVATVVGPNGAGKSTLLRLLLGLLTPNRGGVLLAGRNLTQLTAGGRAARMAYVPQRPAVAAAFTVREVVALGRFGAPGGGRGSAARRAVTDALERVDLANRARDLFQTLSAGQQQRVALARALCQLDRASADDVPAALIVDEPTAALDPKHALQAMRLLRAQAEAGRIVVAAIHDLTAARRFADDALILGGDGRIIADGPVAATLTPDALQRAFDVRFLEAAAPGWDQTALVPMETAQPAQP